MLNGSRCVLFAPLALAVVSSDLSFGQQLQVRAAVVPGRTEVRVEGAAPYSLVMT